MSKSRPQPWTTAKKQTPDNTSSTKRFRTNGQDANKKVKWAPVARWLHLYLSVVSFGLVLFFAVTGLTLNHANWFEDAVRTQEYSGHVKTEWVNPTDTTRIDKLAVVEYLRATHATKGTVSEFRIDDRECSVSFRGPGYAADAYIKRSDGTYELSETRSGLVGVMNDLHKGRDTGSGWSWVIDVTAIFMVLVSASGLFLLLFLKKRRGSGMLWVAIGLAAGIGLYYWLVA